MLTKINKNHRLWEGGLGGYWDKSGFSQCLIEVISAKVA